MHATQKYYEDAIAHWKNIVRGIVDFHRHKDGSGNCISCGHKYPCATYQYYLDNAYGE